MLFKLLMIQLELQLLMDYNKIQKTKRIGVFDFGERIFDVTILKINNNKFNIKAIGGDSLLGGTNKDNLLDKYCINEFKEENDIDILLITKL